MSIPVEVGQVWASTHRKDVANNHNQRRTVLALTSKIGRWNGSERGPDIPAAVLTCDGNGGRMRSTVTLAPDGSIPRHVLVAEPDPAIDQLAGMFDGITTRKYDWRYGSKANLYGWGDGDAREPLSDVVREALLWPRKPDGSENPKIDVLLHQDAILAIAQRIAELSAIVEQNMLTSVDPVGTGYAPAQPAQAAAERLAATLEVIAPHIEAVVPEWGDGEPGGLLDPDVQERLADDLDNAAALWEGSE